MKKITCFLILILAFQAGGWITEVFPEENNDASYNADAQAVKMVVTKFFESLAAQDTNGVMQQISKNYLETDKEGNMIDYAIFKSRVEGWLNSGQTGVIDRKLVEVFFLNLNIQGDKAITEAECTWSALDLDRLEEGTRKLKRKISLSREDGQWKIRNIVYYQAIKPQVNPN